MSENNEWKNELDEQELEQVAGGQISQKSSDDIIVTYRCPKCGATKKVRTSPSPKPHAIQCRNCLVLMVAE